MPRLYLASNNAHKATELSALLAAAGRDWEVRLARELVPGITWDESGSSFLANAQIKAETLRQHTKECVLADDSGLCVDVLGGAPGVHSSRYAGVDGDDRANNAKLLAAIQPWSEAQLTARFECALYFIDAAGRGHAFTGSLGGHLTRQPRGGDGFGYDPFFVVSSSDARLNGRTLAELAAEDKNRISHRAVATAAFCAWLKRYS